VSILQYTFQHISLSFTPQAFCRMHLLHKPYAPCAFTVSLHYSDISILTLFTNRKYAFAVLGLKTRMGSNPSTVVVTITAKGNRILTQPHSYDESLRDSIGGRCRARNDQCDEGYRRCTAPSTETQTFRGQEHRKCHQDIGALFDYLN
jgi:hypothetical protein